MPTFSAPAGVLIRRWPLRAGLPLLALVVDLLLWGGDGATRFGVEAPLWLVVLVAVPVYATLLLVHRPMIGMVTLAAFGTALVVLPTYESFLGLALALFTAARWAGPVKARVAAALTLPPLVVSSLNAASHERTSPHWVLAAISLALWLLLFGAVWLAARALARGDARLRRERGRAETLRTEAVRAERLRISRELHDSVGHALTAMVLRAAGVSRALETRTADPAQIQAALADIQRAGSQSMRELHRLLGLLRSEDGATESEPAPVSALDASAPVVAEARAAGFRPEFTASGIPESLDPSVAQAAARALQEGITNAIKYAVPGSRIVVRQHWSPGRLDLSLTNDVDEKRVAAAPFTGGFGLVGLTERVRVVGGEVSTTRAGDRYTLDVTLPTVEAEGTP